MIERVRERKEQHRARSRTYRVGFATAGSLLILAGIFLSLPFVPGPGTVLILIGLGMLALEFDRAERLLERILDRVERATEQASKAGPVQKALAGAAVVALAAGVVGAAFLWDLPLLPGYLGR